MGTSTAENLTSRFNKVDKSINDLSDKVTADLGNVESNLSKASEQVGDNVASVVRNEVVALLGNKDDTIDTIFGKLNKINETVGNTENKVDEISKRLYGTDATTDTVFDKIATLQSTINGVDGKLTTIDNKLTTIEGQITTIISNTSKQPINASVKAAIANEVSSSCTGNATDCINKILNSLQFRGYINLQ